MHRPWTAWPFMEPFLACKGAPCSRFAQAFDDEANALCYVAATTQHDYGTFSHAFACTPAAPSAAAATVGEMPVVAALPGRYLFIRLPPGPGGAARRLTLCEVRRRPRLARIGPGKLDFLTIGGREKSAHTEMRRCGPGRTGLDLPGVV